MTVANETARIALGEIFTKATILVANVRGHHAQNGPIDSERVETFADAFDRLAGELRELAESMPGDDSIGLEVQP